MRSLKTAHIAISTALAFALIPLSGFATDVYLPSFPAMAEFFGTTHGDIQLSLIVFVISSGIAQLFIGSLVDAFGRYRLSLAALLVFAASSLVIALTSSLTVLLMMRVIQGLSVAMIVVGKRAFFMDVYSGDKLRHYTSMFSITWATAPIVAPFLGGFLQYYFGWESNFYFLGAATLILFTLELVYSGETIKTYHEFKLRPLLNVYSSVLSNPDYTISIVILGISYANVILYNMASPFIIEQVFHQSAVTTGNSSLLSGMAVLVGGLLSKTMINRPIIDKARVLGAIAVILASLGVTVTYFVPSMVSMMSMVIFVHIGSGFTYNTFYTYALGRFSKSAGTVSGITGGGAFILTSLFSYGIGNALHINSVLLLAVAYLIIAVFIAVSLLFFMQAYRRRLLSEQLA